VSGNQLFCECDSTAHRDAETFGRTSRLRRAVGRVHAYGAPIPDGDSFKVVPDNDAGRIAICWHCVEAGHTATIGGLDVHLKGLEPRTR